MKHIIAFNAFPLNQLGDDEFGCDGYDGYDGKSISKSVMMMMVLGGGVPEMIYKLK